MKKVRSLVSHPDNGLKEGISNPLPIKHRKRKQYAKPTFIPQILAFIARAVAYFEQGEYDDDATAFRDFCFDVLDSPRAESAFGRPYPINQECTRKQAYQEAVKLLKCAAPMLRYHGEDSWDFFMNEFRAKRARGRASHEEGLEKALDDMDDVVAKIDNEDQATIEAVLELAKEMEEEGTSGEDE